MRYSFSAQFLMVRPPATTFGEAWEWLCFDLLQRENPSWTLSRLMPPDRGIDILEATRSQAYQCKATNSGELGTMSPASSLESLSTAHSHRPSLPWSTYLLATNAYYSGSGREKLLEKAKALEMHTTELEFLGPDIWDNLCQKHQDIAEKWLSFRILVTEEQMREAFKKARYYDQYVDKFTREIDKADFRLLVTNNRSPVVLDVPFSPELSVKNLLDAIGSLLGVSLKRKNFPDLGTSFGPFVSMTIDRRSQPFRKKIGELALESGDSLEFWIKIVWRDEEAPDGEDVAGEQRMYYALHADLAYKRSKIWEEHLGAALSEKDRREATISRAESLIRNSIWSNVAKLYQ